MKLKIAFVGQPEYFRIHYENMLLSEEFDCKEFAVNPYKPESYSPLIGEEFDYIFFFRGEFVPEGVMKNLKGTKVAISSEPFPKSSSLGMISSQELWERLGIFKSIIEKGYDYIFHYDSSSLDIMKSEGICADGLFYLPISLSPTIIDKPIWDAVFFGRSTKHREEILEPLKRDFNVLHVAHGADSDMLRRICAQARCVLNLGTEDLPTLNPRMQQAMSYGSLVLSESISSNDVFIPNIHFVELQGNDFYEFIKDRKAEDDWLAYDSIALSGYRRTVSALDCNKCWKRIIEALELQK